MGNHIIIGRQVTITKPWSLTKEDNKPSERPKSWKKGVITRVPKDWTDEEIQEETGAKTVKRITSRLNGDIIPTTAVNVAFEDELPTHLIINLVRHRVAT